MDVFLVSVVCCQVEVSATSWSLVQRSPTDCGASLSVIRKTSWMRSWPIGGCRAKNKQSSVRGVPITCFLQCSCWARAGFIINFVKICRPWGVYSRQSGQKISRFLLFCGGDMTPGHIPGKKKTESSATLLRNPGTSQEVLGLKESEIKWSFQGRPTLDCML